MQRYQKFEKEIGVGAYGTVYKATDLHTKQLVALKRIPMEESDDGIPATAVREMSLLKQLKHPNIVSLLNIVLEVKLLYLVFELVDLDLKKLMDLALREKMRVGEYVNNADNNRLTTTVQYKDVFSMKNIQSYMYQIIGGLSYCHSMGVMHRDLKPQNILVSLFPGDGADDGFKYHIKIADFGLARAFMPKRELTLEVVTRWYRPPEILLGSNTYSPSVDIWSLGCIFAELLNQGIPLLPGSSEIDQIHKIFYHFGTPDGVSWPDVVNYPHWRPSFPLWPPLAWGSIVPYNFDATPPGAVDLLSRCFLYEPKLRISATNALKHYWFDSLSESVGTQRQIVSPCTVEIHRDLKSSTISAAHNHNHKMELTKSTSDHGASGVRPRQCLNEDSDATTVRSSTRPSSSSSRSRSSSSSSSSSSCSCSPHSNNSTELPVINASVSVGTTGLCDGAGGANDSVATLSAEAEESPLSTNAMVKANTRSKRRKISENCTDGNAIDITQMARRTVSVRRSVRNVA